MSKPGSESASFSEKLKRAVLRGDVKIARRLIKGGVNLTAKFWYNGTLLHEAVSLGNAEMVQLLLQNNVKVNAQSKDGRTSLHMATRGGNIEIVKKLIAAKADVNIQTKDGRSCLHIAVWRGHKEIGEHLLNAGAKVDVQDEDGWTPLHWAAKSNLFEFARIIMAKGASVNMVNKAGRTPFHECVTHATTPLIKLMLQQGADVNIQPTGKSQDQTTLILLMNNKSCTPECVLTVLTAGYRIRDKEFMNLETLTEQVIGPKSNERILGLMLNNVAPTLMQLCRGEIRRQLCKCHAGKGLLDVIEEMKELPPVLRSYLSFEEEITADSSNN